MKNHIRIKQLRTQRKLSQFELEILAELSPGVLSRIESGKTNPTKETLVKIGKALKLTREEFIYLFSLDLIMQR